VKETVASEFSTAKVAPPPGAASMGAFAAGLAARSQIVWGEHCSECDYPRCYASCAFYDPRPDLHCRRFIAGLEAAPGPDGARLTRIRFRRWGKLEGIGPAGLRPMALAAKRETDDARISQALAAVPAPFAVRRNLAWRWNARKARPAAETTAAPDAFVVEGWSNDGAAHRFTLTFLQDLPTRATFQAPFELTADYGRLEVAFAEIAARIDLASPYLVQIEPVGEAQGIDVVFGLTDFVAFSATKAPAKPVVAAPVLAKVLVWDLDETLWTGTLAEVGVAGVTPRPEAVAAIKALDARGVLQSIASKNNHAEALAALEQFGLADYFLHSQVNWAPKSQSVARIAQALDLGLDSFVFIDDQAFERGEVEAGHASVRTLAHTAVGDLLAHPWFDHPATPESAQRRSLYQAEARRTQTYEAAGGDYTAFLRGSELVLEIADLARPDAERVFELSQRTNQLNFMGAKFSRDEVEARLAPNRDMARLTLRCRDRFGDYGLIGFAELDLAGGGIVQFFMSCRVQRKRVEQAFFEYAAALLRARGHTDFTIAFRPTARNGAAVEMLGELGFVQEAGGGWTRGLADPFEESDIVAVAASPAKAA
jgi:FkbH-like protein